MFIQKFVDIAMFPGTYSSYDITSFPETILIPGPINMNKKIPCFLFVPKGSPKIMVIYAHANGVDIGEIHGRLRYISERLKINILLFDYPGYGKHEGRSDESTVDQCMNLIVSFVTQELSWPIENVVLWGCSIGTGPSTRQAKILNERKKRLGGLILQCPYKSIKHAAESLAGKVGRFLITQRWNIQSEVLECSCPILWIHGKKDSLFSWTGSLEMYNSYHANLRSCHFPKEATHHYFDVEIDIIQPIMRFLDKFVIPNLLTIYYGNCINIGRRMKFDISKAYYSKLNPFRPTLLDVYLTRNTNMKIHKECPNNKRTSKETTLKTIDDNDSDNIRMIGPKDIKSILSLWGNNNKNRDFFSVVNNKVNSLFLEGDFAPKYIWLNGEAGEYINNLKDEDPFRTKSSSSVYLSSSGEDEFENDYENEGFYDFEDELFSDDENSNEEVKCYNRLVNSNLIMANQTYYKGAKQCISYNNLNVYSTINHRFIDYQKFNSKRRNVILNNPSVFRMNCRARIEKMQSNSFTRNDELLLNFWPISNLYCYLYDRYYHFFNIILRKIKQNNISFLNNSNDTFLSIIMWVRRLYYLYTPTLFMNTVYSYKSESDEWLLDGISIGNIYLQLRKINDISGRMVVKLLDDDTISKNFPPPFFITIPLYAPPKPFFQPIAEWIVRTLYRTHVYEVFNGKAKHGNSSNLSQKYPNIDSYRDLMSIKETKCLLEELSFSSLQHFLLCSKRPKIEKLALMTGFGNWLPFGWVEFIIKLFENNSIHFLQRIILNSTLNYVNIIGANYFCLLSPFNLPGFMNMEIIYKVIKTKIVTRSEWNNSRNSNFLDHSDKQNDISSLIHPEVCNNIFNTVFNVINTSLKISNITALNGINAEESILNSIVANKYLLANNQPDWEAILKDFESFSEFMSEINFFCPKISLPGISQVFRVKNNVENKYRDEISKELLNEDKAKFCHQNSVDEADLKQMVDKKDNGSCDYGFCDYESNDENNVHESDLFYDEIESPEQPLNNSFQGKIILMEEKNEINNSCIIEDKIKKSNNQNTSELPLTWESVFFNSSDPLLIINQLQYHDRIYMGMSPSNYIVFHKLLYEKYSFLRLDHESECIFKLLWHFSHCCIYHGSLLKNINRNSCFPHSNIHPLHCLLLISGIIRRAIDNPNDADLWLLNWENSSNEKRYYGFNSSCYLKSSLKTLNILEKVLSISIELIENGVCNTIIDYSTDMKRNRGEPDTNINKKSQGRNDLMENDTQITRSGSDIKVYHDQIEKKAIEDSVTSNSNISDSISNGTSSSSRISSFESLILNFNGNQVNSNNLKYTENQKRVVILSSTNVNVPAEQKEMQILKRNTSKRQIKDTKMVNLYSSYAGKSHFSPIITSNVPNFGTLDRDKHGLGKSIYKGGDLSQDIGMKNKNKVSSYSPLRIFRR
ncbi:alpha beta hydrolase [Cryptosporidium ryanae]|uniref:alpha beta hydrolase n=1 Tax=Cryptosporidium ryanae TaxID=515981 RepID=UPI00351AA731|nr:alpha beta hydrolase [Cryptosporidium ryanae]